MKRWPYFFMLIGSFMLLASAIVVTGALCHDNLIPENIFLFTSLASITGYYLIWADILLRGKDKSNDQDDTDDFDDLDEF